MANHFVYLVASIGFPNPDLRWALEEATLGVNCLGFAAPMEKRAKGCTAGIVPNHSALGKPNDSRVTR